MDKYSAILHTNNLLIFKATIHISINFLGCKKNAFQIENRMKLIKLMKTI